jgi:putative membrane protein (TIGR04086 family)
MNVHWSAVLFGWLVDFALSLLLQVFIFWIGLTEFFEAPDPSILIHMGLLSLFVLFTGIGGFVAARLAEESYLINGLLVGVTGVLIAAVLNGSNAEVDRVFVIGQLAGCLLAALGGYAALLISQRQV